MLFLSFEIRNKYNLVEVSKLINLDQLKILLEIRRERKQNTNSFMRFCKKVKENHASCLCILYIHKKKIEQIIAMRVH